MLETGESSIQKRPFIDNTELLAETPLKKTNKIGGPKLMKYGIILSKDKK